MAGQQLTTPYVLPPREIARRLGLPGATVRKRLSRALQHVGRRLREELDEDEVEWRTTLSALAGSAPRPLPLEALPLLAAGAAALLVLAVAVRAFVTEPATAAVRVVSELGALLPGSRVFQLDGDELRELSRDEAGDHFEAQLDRGPLIVIPENRPPQVFPPPSEAGERSLVLRERAWFTGSIYVRGEPPEEPLDLRLLVPLTSIDQLPAAVLAAGVLDLEEGALVLRTRTGGRGYFEFGGLELGESVRLLVPDDMRLTFRNDGELLEGGRGLRTTPGRELVWLGALPR